MATILMANVSRRKARERTKVTEKGSLENGTNQRWAATEPMEGKEKPSRNLDMEGQRVRTTKPPRNTRTTAALAQRIAEKLRRPKPKEGAHNNCPYDHTAKEETAPPPKKSLNQLPTTSENHWKPRERSPQPKVPET